MEQAARLAGYYTAHAVWSVSDGGPLIPLLGAESHQGERSLQRFASGRVEEAAAAAQASLEASDAPCAVAIVDGFLTLPRGRTDALFVSIRRREANQALTLELAVPYRPTGDPRGFAVRPPKILSYDGEPEDLAAFTDAFFAGVDGHEQGARVWNERLEDDGGPSYRTPDTLPPTGVAPEPVVAEAARPTEVPQRLLVAMVGVGLAAAMLLTPPPDDGALRLLWGLPGALLALATAAAAALPLLRR